MLSTFRVTFRNIRNIRSHECESCGHVLRWALSIRTSLGCARSLVELLADWSVDDWAAFETDRKSVKTVREIWQSEFDALWAAASMFNSANPECIGRSARIQMLRELHNIFSRSLRCGSRPLWKCRIGGGRITLKAGDRTRLDNKNESGTDVKSQFPSLT